VVEAAPDPDMTVDLTRCRIIPPSDAEIEFAIPAERRDAMLAGLDELDVLLKRVPELDAFQCADREVHPWIWPHEH
jgi:3-isopropylmalate dehydratase small subunit